MITKDQLQEGLEVLYTSHKKQQKGLVSSWNERFIFVDYGTGTAQATRYEDLQLANPPPIVYYRCLRNHFSADLKCFMYEGNLVAEEQYIQMGHSEQINYTKEEENKRGSVDTEPR